MTAWLVMGGWAVATWLLWRWLFNATDKGRRLEEQRRSELPDGWEPPADLVERIRKAAGR